MEPSADPDRLLELIGANWTTQVIRVAAELGIPDALTAGPRSIPELAVELGAQEDSLRRLVRALCALDLCEEVEYGLVEVTPTGALLASGEGSLGPWARWWGDASWGEWGNLIEAVRTGEPVRSGDGFAHLAEDPERAELFDDAMAGLSALAAPEIVAALELRGDELVIDLGGGTGALVRAVLERHPETRAVVVDAPRSLVGARERLARWGIAERCTAVAGDLFSEAPTDGDAYLLKSILHDWDDHDARRILEQCRGAGNPAARILVVERLVPEVIDRSDATRSTIRMDLHMLVAQGGRERTESELRNLLRSAGLRTVEVRRCGAVAVIEAVQADV